jgi:predicted Zn finger-like uncharacterized protein
VNVRCPECATEYRLPEELLGERGARVRCPRCRWSFIVHSGDEAIAAESPPPSPALENDPESFAAALLDRLAEELGARWAAARARGRILSELGPDLMRAYGEYRAALGPAASADAFRQALRARWGLTLRPEGVAAQKEGSTLSSGDGSGGRTTAPR